MAAIEIEYCVPCGLLKYAIESQQVLLETYGRELDAVTLKPGHGGVFTIRIDGEPVFDKDEDGGYDLDTVTAAVAARIGAPA